MKKQIAGILASLALTGWALTAIGQSPDTDQVQFPQITSQPTDVAVAVGASTVLSVQSTNADSFQWLLNGVVMEGETNSTLTLQHVSKHDVGYYTCCIQKGSEVVPTRTATVTAYESTGGGTITVFGLPVVSSGSPAGSCPGPYAGYIHFIK